MGKRGWMANPKWYSPTSVEMAIFNDKIKAMRKFHLGYRGGAAIEVTSDQITEKDAIREIREYCKTKGLLLPRIPGQKRIWNR